MNNNLLTTSTLDTQLLSNLNGAVALLNFDPIRIECLSCNRWGNEIKNRSIRSTNLDNVVNGIEVVANIEEQAETILEYLSTNPLDNYSDVFKLNRLGGATQHLIFNASIAQMNSLGKITSCLCVILDVSNNVITGIVDSKQISNINKDKISLSKFSKREQEVIKEMMNGLTSKEIANKLFITENTVETYRGRIYKKAGVRNVVGLVRRVSTTFENS